MSRNISSIYNEMLSAKEQNPELQGLNSGSSTAIWRLWMWVVAAAIFTVEMFHDLFIAEVENIISTKTAGTLFWYRSRCLDFRYGVALEVHDGRITYPADDTTSPLLAQCSVSEAADGLIVKIAKDDDGELVPLSNTPLKPEFDAFVAYLSSIKYAGTPIRVINSPANLLRMQITVFYDPLLISPTGTLLSDSSRIIDDTIADFLRNLEFDGRLKRSSLVQAIKSAQGVKDAYITLLEHKYKDYWYVPIEVSHIPESGYFKIDPSFPLTSSITYLSYV